MNKTIEEQNHLFSSKPPLRLVTNKKSFNTLSAFGKLSKNR